MAKTSELPELVTEFTDLAKQYLKEQTLAPAKALGRLAGLGLLAAVMFTIAAGFLAVAGVRFLVEVLPDGRVWSGFGYMLAALGLVVVTGLIAWRTAK